MKTILLLLLCLLLLSSCTVPPLPATTQESLPPSSSEEAVESTSKLDIGFSRPVNDILYNSYEEYQSSLKERLNIGEDFLEYDAISAIGDCLFYQFFVSWDWDSIPSPDSTEQLRSYYYIFKHANAFWSFEFIQNASLPKEENLLKKEEVSSDLLTCLSQKDGVFSLPRGIQYCYREGELREVRWMEKDTLVRFYTTHTNSFRTNLLGYYDPTQEAFLTKLLDLQRAEEAVEWFGSGEPYPWTCVTVLEGKEETDAYLSTAQLPAPFTHYSALETIGQLKKTYLFSPQGTVSSYAYLLEKNGVELLWTFELFSAASLNPSYDGGPYERVSSGYINNEPSEGTLRSFPDSLMLASPHVKHGIRLAKETLGSYIYYYPEEFDSETQWIHGEKYHLSRLTSRFFLEENAMETGEPLVLECVISSPDLWKYQGEEENLLQRLLEGDLNENENLSSLLNLVK